MNTKAIFITGAQPFFVDVGKILAAQDGWYPCYWVATPDLGPTIRGAFPGIVFHSHYDAWLGIRPAQCAHIKLPSLDHTILAEMAFHECMILKMMDRMDAIDTFPYGERVRSYHYQLQYWLGILNHFRPDIVVFKSGPHEVYDYILYVLCRLSGVRTLILEDLSHTLPGFLLAYESFEEGFARIGKTYHKLLELNKHANLALSADMERYCARFSGAYAAAMPEYIRARREVEANESSKSRLARKLLSIHLYPRYVLSVLRRLHRLASNTGPRRYMKERGRTLEGSKPVRGLKLRAYQARSERYKRRLHDHYHSLTQEVDLNETYVFVGLHYQPELTSSPYGGFFVHQHLLIDMISKAVPEGWYVYVKEHPDQFRIHGNGERSRSGDLYDDAASQQNVRLVPLCYSPFELIDNARCVATITGTVGWEAVMRGKPALVFGYPWYRSCEGVFLTHTKEALDKALTTIGEGYQINANKVRLFLHVLEMTCLRGYTGATGAVLGSPTDLNSRENIASIVHAIRSHCGTLYPEGRG